MDPGTIAEWQKESPHLLGILMEYYEDEHLPKDVLVLVAAKVDHRRYQRVGHLLLDSGFGAGRRMNIVLKATVLITSFLPSSLKPSLDLLTL